MTHPAFYGVLPTHLGGLIEKLRLIRWAADGTWQRILAALLAQVDAEGDLGWVVAVDSTIVRARQHAAGARKKGRWPERQRTMPSAGQLTSASSRLRIGWPPSPDSPRHRTTQGRRAATCRPRHYHCGLQRVFSLSAQTNVRYDPNSRTFYDRKRAEGRRHRQAVIALACRRANALGPDPRPAALRSCPTTVHAALTWSWSRVGGC